MSSRSMPKRPNTGGSLEIYFFYPPFSLSLHHSQEMRVNIVFRRFVLRSKVNFELLKGIWLLWLYFFAYSQCCQKTSGKSSKGEDLIQIHSEFPVFSFCFSPQTPPFGSGQIVDIDWCFAKSAKSIFANDVAQGIYSQGCPGERFNWLNFLKEKHSPKVSTDGQTMFWDGCYEKTIEQTRGLLWLGCSTRE